MFVRDDASILHADLDSFYASVEQRDDPALRGRPVIVGMGVVLAASYEAKAFGVRTAMGGKQARRLCPTAVDGLAADDGVHRGEQGRVRRVRRHDAARRGAVHRRGVPRRRRAAPCVRNARSTSPPACAPTCASEWVCRSRSASPAPSSWPRWPAAWPSPTGCWSSRRAVSSAFLHPLPVERLWGVGAKTADKLHARGITTVADVARVGEGPLVAILGPFAGRHLHALAHNRDPRRVEVGRRRRSIGSQHAIGRSRHGPRSQEEIDAVLVGIVDRVTRRLRAAAPRRAHGRAAAALRRLRPRHALAHDRGADGGDRDRPGRGPRTADRRRCR